MNAINPFWVFVKVSIYFKYFGEFDFRFWVKTTKFYKNSSNKSLYIRVVSYLWKNCIMCLTIGAIFLPWWLIPEKKHLREIDTFFVVFTIWKLVLLYLIYQNKNYSTRTFHLGKFPIHTHNLAHILYSVTH